MTGLSACQLIVSPFGTFDCLLLFLNSSDHIFFALCVCVSLTSVCPPLSPLITTITVITTTATTIATTTVTAQDEYHPKHDTVYCWRTRRLMACSKLSVFEEMAEGTVAKVSCLP